MSATQAEPPRPTLATAPLDPCSVGCHVHGSAVGESCWAEVCGACLERTVLAVRVALTNRRKQSQP